MLEQSPTLPQWKPLYEQALQFKQLACWTWMTEENIFGIQDPKTGEIGYCCVIGSLGEVFGLIVYLGSEGLDGFKKLRAKRREPGSLEGLLLHNCLSLTFDDRKYVHKEEHEIIKQLGLSVRGRNAYPIFKNLKPGYFPWSITSDEAVYLTHALTQAEDVCLRFKEQKTLLDPPARGEYFVRTPELNGDEITWRDQWLKPAPVKPKPLSVQLDELRLQRLKSRNFKMQGVWEFDYAFADIPTKESDRPFFPCFLIVADHEAGFIFHSHMGTPDAYPSQFANSFIECLEKTGFLPMEILLAKDEAKLILEPITSRLGIKLTKVTTCKEANRARREFVKFMARR
jgi:hypothetical protein